METTFERRTARPHPNENLKDRACLHVQGADQAGIVAAVATTLARHGANIVSLAQHTTDPEGGRFFQRTVFELPGLAGRREELEADLEEALGGNLGQTWTLTEVSRMKRAAIFVSKTDHNLLDLLWRQRRGEIPMEIVMVVGNHQELAEEVKPFGIPFHYVPVVGPNGKAEAEAKHLELLDGTVDFVILARYMQIISETFLDKVGVPVINIHHSFLPAFIGAGPYQKAKDRGVKLIGATAHYVTKDLDEGPIIEQDVTRVSHVDTTADLTRKGALVEREVLSRAVTWHCEDRVLRDGNSTIVFSQ